MRAAAIPVARARELLIAEVVPTAAEPVPVGECLGRVCATPVRAAIPLPAFDNSAMDGYAVRSADLAAGAVPLRIVAESRAGFPAEAALTAGEAARISTGAAMPSGADAVVPVEEAREEGDAVIPTVAPVRRGAHVRRAGEDLEAGAEALPAGSLIDAGELGLLAGLGCETVVCRKRPRVRVLTGGDELLAPGQPPAMGKIYDSNRFTLLAMARQAGAEASFGGVMPDALEPTKQAIAAALDADLVVLAGGVSVGRHDYVKEALAELGVEQLFWRVALRPGGPTWGGVAHRGGRKTLVLGLPGNPVSAQVTFRIFATPAILAMSGRNADERLVSAALAEPYLRRGGSGRDVYLRCRLEPGPDGWQARLTTDSQGSHILRSMLGANGLAVIPADRDEVEAGEAVTVVLL